MNRLVHAIMVSIATGKVRDQESLGKDFTSLAATTKLHIAFGIDENYARYMGVLITSIAAYNQDLALTFHIFADSIKEADRRRLAQLADTRPIRIEIYYIDTAAVSSLPAANHYSTATYYRILMPAILQGSVARVLYLDSDIICLGSLKGLMSLDLTDFPVAAVADVPAVAAEKIQELHLRSGLYFNAGVMMIDIDRWVAADLSSQVLQVLMAKAGQLSLQDQDALNLVLDGNVAIMAPIWNQIYDMGQMTHDPLPETKFLHYTGSVKPWRLVGRHRLSNLYRDFEAQSPWSGSPLLVPENYKEMEIYARLSLKDGAIFTALTWYYFYLLEKIRRLFH